MFKKIAHATIVPLVLALLISAASIGIEASAITNEENSNKSKYGVNLLILYDDEGYLPLYQQMSQNLVIGSNVKATSIDQFNTSSLQQYDGAYLHISEGNNLEEEIVKELVSYVNNGGRLIMDHTIINSFPTAFTGVEGGKSVDIMDKALSYPDTGKDFQGIQKVAKAFEADYRAYARKPLKVNGLKVNTAEAVIAQGKEALFTVNSYNKGLVMVLSEFLPNFTKYITSFDFQHRGEENEYFQFFYAAGNWQFLNELVSTITKDKYGFSMKKVMGPYGRPAMAWQNHYEVLSSIGNKDMISWIDYLKNFHQVPTFSLVRGSYEWGQWHSTITYHLNQKDNKTPVFLGEEETSFYSNGRFIMDKNNDYLTFGKLPEYKSYYQKFTNNFRPYPYFVDWDGDELTDLLVGTYDGKIGLLKNIGTNEEPQYDDISYLKYNMGRDISIGENAAPTLLDYNGDGLMDIIVGSKKGKVFLLKNNEDGFSLPEFLYDTAGEKIEMTSDSAPFAKDLNGDDITDLVLGDGNGRVYIYEGTEGSEGLQFNTPQQLIFAGKPIPVERYATPHVGDYNNDGKMDILIGDGSGYIHIVIGTGNSFYYDGKLTTERKNIYGENLMYTGKNVVPFLVDYNNDGVMDLATGQLSFALTYDTAHEDFIHKKELAESLEYAKKNFIPVIPHIYFHSHKDNELEKREIELHMENYQKLGLPWGYTGTNQHTWRVNIDEPTQSFRNLMEYNVWYNFGFKVPNAPTDPTFAYDYLWPLPFVMMEGEEKLPLVLFEPAPFFMYFRGAYSNLASMDVPLSFFEHIEYKMEEGTKGNNLIKNMVSFAQEIRYKYNYAFVTEDQMAKTFINNFYTDYDVYIDGESIKLVTDTSRVPKHLAREYIGTGGVKLELGERYKSSSINTDALIQYEVADGLYVGIVNDLQLNIGGKDTSNPLHIIMVNSPVNYRWENETLVIQLNSKGMKQLKISSSSSLDIAGDNPIVEKEDNIYTITHYGEETEIRIKINQ
ncbi:VCBS repeat-containing protein [Alkaliphilus pronyensis]|uniref:VCBS repeat-containing protein n=1 Tax=Alkaliphilus pronyensis TaxID=1482732 RepID=A0A6I0EZH3_9FIRM|nr:VCBS repeat-containing protein [Alkaliphilus pronyensis]KAB3534717.1 VCBS repeat-containing protein [Alkaliphilus pronyensis]